MKNHSQLLTYEDHAAVAVKRISRLVLFLSLIGYGLYSLLLVPLYTQLSANISYQDAAVTYILYYAFKGLELAVFFAVFAATIFAVFRRGFWGSRSVWITFSVATIVKFLANFIMDCIFDGSVPSFTYFVSKDLPIILPNLLMELGQYAIVLFMAVLILGRSKKKWEMNVLLDGDLAGGIRSTAFPMAKLLSFKNPVQVSTFATAILIFVTRAFSHLLYQLAQIVYIGDWEGPLVLTVDLVSDLLLAAIAYFVMVLLLSAFDRREMEALSNVSEGSST